MTAGGKVKEQHFRYCFPLTTGSSTLLRPDIQRSRGPQGQVVARIDFGRLGRDQGKGDALGQGGEQEMAFYQREMIAKADARACAEG